MMKDHVGLLVLLGLLFVVELCALVGGQSTNSGEGSSREGVALNLGTVFLGLPAVVELLTGDSESGAGNGGNDLFVLGHALGLVLAVIIVIVGAGGAATGASVIVAVVAGIISATILVLLLIIVRTGGSSTADVAAAGRGEIAANLFY
jgi:hypothetical protein